MPQLAKILGTTFFDPDVPKFFKRVIPEAMNERLKDGIRRNDLLDAFMEIQESFKDEKNDLHYCEFTQVFIDYFLVKSAWTLLSY